MLDGNMRPSAPQKLCALWHGGDLSYIERLCLASMLDTGHYTVLYTYHGVSNVPAGIDHRDAREIMPEAWMVRHRRMNSFALGSDLFRYLLLQKGEGGCWTDCDSFFLKPLPQSEHIFGWEQPHSIATGVLRLPADSAVLVGLLSVILSGAPLPWWGRAKRARHWLRGCLGMRRRGLSELPWAATGPRAMTHFAGVHKISHLAAPISVFYPNPAVLAADAFDMNTNFETLRIRPETIAVHLWRTELQEHGIGHPDPGSWVHRQCVRLGIEYPGAAVRVA